MWSFNTMLRFVLVLLIIAGYSRAGFAQIKVLPQKQVEADTKAEAGTKISTEEEKLAEFCALEENIKDERCSES